MTIHKTRVDTANYTSNEFDRSFKRRTVVESYINLKTGEYTVVILKLDYDGPTNPDQLIF